MTIAEAWSHTEAIPLARPYTIAFRSIDRIETVIVKLRDDAGRCGLGAASPEAMVTGETNAACQAALVNGLDFLRGQDVRTWRRLGRTLDARMPGTPAARAAVDMALADLWAQGQGLPLVDALGRAHDALATSITIGIKPVEEALVEVNEYLARGFRVLKIKLGRTLDEDVDRLARIRDRVGAGVVLRADPNQGYSVDDTRCFMRACEGFDIEMVEQPVRVTDTESLRGFDATDRARLCLDEALLGPTEALRWAQPPQPAGIWNIKLMKCGGVRAALRMADVAETAGIALMWGCMDESRIAISAALHTALACPATRYLDLDGSFDLARDVAEGGFVIEAGGVLRPTGDAGLGLRLL